MAEKKRVVIKIGSSSLTNKEGSLHREAFLPFVQSIVDIRKEDVDIILVSSGAIAAGRGLLSVKHAPKTIPEKQALAALGQSSLIQTWSEAFDWYGIHVGQLLLTRHDVSDKESYGNVLGCLLALLDKKVIPIINENDSVRARGKNFGDNDMLAALISALVRADLLIIFTDTPGLYSKDPAKHSDAKHIGFVEEISPELLASGGETSSSVGTGGMRAKLEAAKRAMYLGVPSFIGMINGNQSVRDIIAHKGRGTYFENPARTSMSQKKQWILFHSEIGGDLTIDPGAEKALLHGGKSLLPVGVRTVRGDFSDNAIIQVYNESGELLGRGKTRYSSEQLRKILAAASSEEKNIARAKKDEVIHRDDWASIHE